jgi:hypothetical protein
VVEVAAKARRRPDLGSPLHARLEVESTARLNDVVLPDRLEALAVPGVVEPDGGDPVEAAL